LSELVKHPCCISRHIGTFSDIWHCAMNMRPSTCKQMVSPNSILLPDLSVQKQSIVPPWGVVTSAKTGWLNISNMQVKRFMF
jgi:hypothetical protein